MAQLRRHKDRFDALGAVILLVGMGTVDQTAAFRRQLDVPFHMVCDPRRSVYEAFALKRVSPLGFLSPVLAVKGLAAISKGHVMGVPKGDIRQLGGVFIIDEQGTVVYQYAADSPADHPDAAALITSVNNLQKTTLPPQE